MMRCRYRSLVLEEEDKKVEHYFGEVLAVLAFCDVEDVQLNQALLPVYYLYHHLQLALEVLVVGLALKLQAALSDYLLQLSPVPG